MTSEPRVAIQKGDSWEKKKKEIMNLGHEAVEQGKAVDTELVFLMVR